MTIRSSAEKVTEEVTASSVLDLRYWTAACTTPGVVSVRLSILVFFFSLFGFFLSFFRFCRHTMMFAL